MFPLTNTAVLAPLIVGFTLEQVEMESLSASHFRSIVTKFRQQGMSEEEITSKLFTLLDSKGVEVTTLVSTGIYTEPAGVAESVSTWMNAENTPSARDELIGVLICRFISLSVISLMDGIHGSTGNEFLL